MPRAQPVEFVHFGVLYDTEVSFYTMKNGPVENALQQLEVFLVNSLLPTDAIRQHSEGDIGKEYLLPIAASLKRISAGYVEGCRIPPQNLTGSDAVAYALYYLPVNFFKLRLLLLDLPEPCRKKQYDVLDFGCGPGTGLLAARSVLDPRCSYIGIDASPAMIDTARKLNQSAPWKAANVDFFTGSIVPDRQFNMIIAANVISELGTGRGFELLEVFRDSLAHKGTLMILEPGSREITINLMILRDLFIARFPDMAIHFPCTRMDTCPMLASSSVDWCHGTTGWEEPRIVRQLDQLTDFNKHRMKFSAVVFVRDGTPRKGFRALRNAEKTNKGISFPVCGPDAFGECLATKKHSADLKHTARRIRQYDLVQISSIDEKHRIGEGATLVRMPFRND